MMGTRGECKPRVQDFNYCPQRLNSSIEGIPTQGSLVFPKKIVFFFKVEMGKNWIFFLSFLLTDLGWNNEE